MDGSGTDGSGSEQWAALPDAPELIEEMLLTDLGLIAEVTHPIRSALLFRLRRPRSAAELAAEMSVPVTRLYHHLNRLEQLGLISVVATRRSGAKIERRYRNVAAGFRLDPEVVRTAPEGELAKALGALFDVAKHELLREIETGALAPHAFRGLSTIGLNELLLTDAQREEFVSRLRALIDDYAAFDACAGEEEVDPAAHRFRIFVAGFPVTT